MTILLSSFDIPIIATGGISKIHHIRQLKQAGATLFAMTGGIVVDLYCIPKLNDELAIMNVDFELINFHQGELDQLFIQIDKNYRIK